MNWESSDNSKANAIQDYLVEKWNLKIDWVCKKYLNAVIVANSMCDWNQLQYQVQCSGNWGQFRHWIQ